MVYKGSIKSLIFKGEEGYVVLRVELDKKYKDLKQEIIVTGHCPDLDMVSKDKAKGLLCTIEGKLTRHPKHGLQIEASSIEIDMTGLAFFFSHVVKGLGKKLTTQLLEKYGPSLEDVLENNPEVLLNEKGIKEKKLKKIVESWNQFKQLRELYAFFSSYNVPIGQKTILKIYKEFSEDYPNIPDLIRENPFIVTEVDGIGFKTAFKIAQCFDYDPYHPSTIKAVVDYVLIKEAKENGHTYLSLDELLDRIQEEMPEADREIYKSAILSNLVGNNNEDNEYLLKSVEDGKGGQIDLIGLRKLYYQEAWVYNDIKKRLSRYNNYVITEDEFERFIQRKQKELGITLGDKQYEAIKEVATKGHNFFILCGYAGTGKSTISKIIIDFYKEYFFKDGIISCAFTGMASKRIAETTKHEASTIHSLLRIGKEGPEFNRSNPLPHKLALIDEASMINLWLFYTLLKAIHPQAVIIVVGDDAQLPPIGEGNVFADLLKKDWIPKVKLDRIYRQSQDSVLTYFASYIRKGEIPPELNIFKENRYKDFILLPRNVYVAKEASELEKEEARQKVYAGIQKDILQIVNEIKSSNQLQRKDAIWNIQIITAMRKGELGTVTLNKLLQDHLNSNPDQEVEIKHHSLRSFDKVIHLKNKEMITMDKNTYFQIKGSVKKLSLDELAENKEIVFKQRIYNGNMGMVLDIDEDSGMFTAVYPDGIRDKVVFYMFDDFKDIVDLGYALTIHKTQGNQFKFVIMPITNSHYVMLNNKLMYTAVTRAKEKAYVVGQSFAFKLACTNIDKTFRRTWISLDGHNGFALEPPSNISIGQKSLFEIERKDNDFAFSL